MKNSDDIQVKEFVAKHEQKLNDIAEVDGAIVGFYSPLIRDLTKVPIPCRVSWSLSQVIIKNLL